MTFHLVEGRARKTVAPTKIRFEAIDPFQESFGVRSGIAWAVTNFDVNRIHMSEKISSLGTAPDGEPTALIDGHGVFEDEFARIGAWFYTLEDAAVHNDLQPV